MRRVFDELVLINGLMVFVMRDALDTTSTVSQIQDGRIIIGHGCTGRGMLLLSGGYFINN